MEEKNLQKTLEKAFPETPAVFHGRLRETADSLIREDKKMKSQKLLRMALACALILSLTGGALAAMNHYGVLNFNPGWNEGHYFTLPGAEDMIQYDLAEAKTGDLIWRVKEAAYDGRVLRILYSVRDTNAQADFDGEDAMGDYYGLLDEKGVFLQCDGTGEIFVDGQGVNLENIDMRYGQAPGELEGWMDCRMEGDNDLKLRPEGEITVSMPFHFTDEAAKDKSGADALTFTMNVGDTASRYALKLPDPYTLDTGAVVEITDLHFSPVTVFIDGVIHLSGEGIPQKPEDPDKYWDWAASIPEYAALFDLRLENADGELLGESTGGFTGAQTDGSGVDILFRYEGTPSGKYTDVNNLCFGKWKVPIRLIYEE